MADDAGDARGWSAVHFLIRVDGTTQFGFWNMASIQNQFSFSPYANTWVQVATAYNSTTQTITTYVNGTLMDTDTYNPAIDPGETPNLAGAPAITSH